MCRPKIRDGFTQGCVETSTWPWNLTYSFYSTYCSQLTTTGWIRKTAGWGSRFHPSYPSFLLIFGLARHIKRNGFNTLLVATLLSFPIQALVVLYSYVAGPTLIFLPAGLSSNTTKIHPTAFVTSILRRQNEGLCASLLRCGSRCFCPGTPRSLPGPVRQCGRRGGQGEPLSLKKSPDYTAFVLIVSQSVVRPDDVVERDTVSLLQRGHIIRLQQVPRA